MKEHPKINAVREMRKEQFEVLYRISDLLNRSQYSDNLMEQALDLVIRILDAERGIFARFDPGNGRFSLLSARNLSEKEIPDLNTFSSGILKQVADSGQPCLYHDAQSDPDVSQFESIQLHKIKSVIGVPIFYHNSIWGVIVVDSRENRQEFSEENLLFLEYFSSLVSLSLNRIQQIEDLRHENIDLQQRLQQVPSLPEIIGTSPAVEEVAGLIQKVAQTNATVLLLGESGTGKELAARAIHLLSDRKARPFMAQFCGSIPENLLESELFGYKKGAFTGAYADKKGLLESADHGTLLLDEIGDISLALQAKLLRVLQNQEITRVGDTEGKKIDIRIIAATNKDIHALVKEGTFREDLFYRLNVFPVTLPPLRERRGDVAQLATHFLEKYGSPDISLDRAAMSKLEKFDWPGNIRQLENVIQRALILRDGNTIKEPDIIFEEKETLAGFSGSLKDFEMLLLRKRLREFNDNRTRAAKSLGVSVRWIQLKLKDLEK